MFQPALSKTSSYQKLNPMFGEEDQQAKWGISMSNLESGCIISRELFVDLFSLN